MEVSEYQELSRRTRNKLDRTDSLANAALGLVGEAGEVSELIKKDLFHFKYVKRESIKDELGDVMFYIAWLCDLFQLDMREVMYGNIEKLKKRWPDGFKGGEHG